MGWYLRESSPLWPPDSILVRFLCINFHSTEHCVVRSCFGFLQSGRVSHLSLTLMTLTFLKIVGQFFWESAPLLVFGIFSCVDSVCAFFAQEYHRSEAESYSVHPITWHVISGCPVAEEFHTDRLIYHCMITCFPCLVNKCFVGRYINTLFKPLSSSDLWFYSFTYRHQYGPMASYFIQWVIIYYCHYFDG